MEKRPVVSADRLEAVGMVIAGREGVVMTRMRGAIDERNGRVMRLRHCDGMST